MLPVSSLSRTDFLLGKKGALITRARKPKLEEVKLLLDRNLKQYVHVIQIIIVF